MTNDTSLIIKFLKNLWTSIKVFTFKTEVVNQVKIPEIVVAKVVVPNFPTDININNLDEIKYNVLKENSDKIIKFLDSALKKLEPVKDKELILSVNEIKDILKIESKDFTPELISEVKAIVKIIEKKDIDLSNIENIFKDFKKSLDKVTRYDEIKVRLPDKQVEKLSKSIISSSGGSTNSTDTLGKQINPATSDKQDDIIDAVNNVSGLQRSTDMYGTGLVTVGITAVEVEIAGTPESMTIQYPAITANTGQLYIGKSNVTNAGVNAIHVLLPGESIELDYNDVTNAIYVVSDTASQSFIAGGLL